MEELLLKEFFKFLSILLQMMAPIVIILLLAGIWQLGNFVGEKMDEFCTYVKDKVTK